jgi:phage terminase large subunit-like protein
MDCPPRFGTKRSPERATLGPALGVVAALLGKPLMAWQQHVANIVLEIDPETGELAYDEYALTVPRQSGKSTFILAKSTHRCSATSFFGARQRIVYTAQTRLKAREKFEIDYMPDLKSARKFRTVVTHLGNGNEHFKFPNGSRFGIEANTEKAGHGGTLDEGFIDEAFAQTDNRAEQAMGPAMITRKNKQLGVISTAGWLDASVYLWEKVVIGRGLVEQDVRLGTAYFEWSAPEDADPSDEDVWLACMPAVHRRECPPKCSAHTVTLTAIRNEFAKAQRSGKLSDFRRAYLNQWVLKPREGEETALGNWAACAVEIGAADLPAATAIGVSVSLDRDWTSIGVAGILDDGTPLVAAAHRRLGTDWAAIEAARISTTYDIPAVVDVGGPAGELMAQQIEEEGGTVVRAKLGDYVTACADIYDRAHRRAVKHTNAPNLNTQVAGARWRSVGDGRRVFGRKQSETDIDMLEAVTLALWGAEQGAISEPSAYYV